MLHLFFKGATEKTIYKYYTLSWPEVNEKIFKLLGFYKDIF
jgi:hypothetical protein